MSLHKKFLVSIFSILVGTGFLACGGGTNNDQGTSFLAYGWYKGTPPEGSTGDVINIMSDVAESADGTAGFATAWIGLENRLANQFIRVERIDCSYYVDGSVSGFTIPDDSEFVSSVLGANPPSAGGSSAFGGNIGTRNGIDGDQLFASGEARPQTTKLEFMIVSQDLVRYLNLNRNSLPPTPYTLSVVCRANGISQAGDVLTTNPLSYPVYIVSSPGSTAQADGVLANNAENDATVSNIVTSTSTFNPGLGASGTSFSNIGTDVSDTESDSEESADDTSSDSDDVATDE